MKRFIAPCGALVLLLSGCASIIKGGTQDISISSSPSGATFEVKDNKNQLSTINGSTPGTVTLKKGTGYFSSASYTITVSKEGYQPHVVTLSGSVNGWYLGGNLIFGGLIGYLVVDPLTGAMWTLSPDKVQAGLALASTAEPPAGEAPSPADQSSSDNATMLHVMLAQDVPVDMWAELRPLR
jgi:hypothetical protein